MSARLNLASLRLLLNASPLRGTSDWSRASWSAPASGPGQGPIHLAIHPGPPPAPIQRPPPAAGTLRDAPSSLRGVPSSLRGVTSSLRGVGSSLRPNFKGDLCGGPDDPANKSAARRARLEDWRLGAGDFFHGADGVLLGVRATRRALPPGVSLEALIASVRGRVADADRRPTGFGVRSG